jgi:hypothetical protein
LIPPWLHLFSVKLQGCEINLVIFKEEEKEEEEHTVENPGIHHA